MHICENYGLRQLFWRFNLVTLAMVMVILASGRVFGSSVNSTATGFISPLARTGNNVNNPTIVTDQQHPVIGSSGTFSAVAGGSSSIGTYSFVDGQFSGTVTTTWDGTTEGFASLVASVLFTPTVTLNYQISGEYQSVSGPTNNMGIFAFIQDTSTAAHEFNAYEVNAVNNGPAALDLSGTQGNSSHAREVIDTELYAGVNYQVEFRFISSAQSPAYTAGTTTGSFDFTFAPVPEPSSLGLLAVVAALSLARVRRRRA